MPRDYSVFVHVIGPGNLALAARDTYPGLGSFPTSQWQPGDTIRETYRLPITYTAAPGLVWLEAGLYDLATGQRLPTSDAQGKPVGFPAIARVKILSRQPAPPPTVTRPARYDLGGQISFLGYDLAAQESPAAPLRLTLYWQAGQRPTEDLTVFLHLVDSEGRPIAQADSQPRGGDYPTSFWDPGEVVTETRSLVWPAQTPPGEYRLTTGLYLLRTLERLPVRDSAGQPVPGDAIPLGTIGIP